MHSFDNFNEGASSFGGDFDDVSRQGSRVYRGETKVKFVNQGTVRDSDNGSLGKQSTIKPGTLAAKKQGPSEFINNEI